MRRNGFTFIEMLIAVVIGAFITVTAAAAMRGIVSGSQTHQRLTELSDEMRYACGLVRNDLCNLYRSQDFRQAKFELGYLDGGEGLSAQRLTFYTVSRSKARPMQPEGEVYEVEYCIKGDPDTGQSVLMRRYCPVVPGVVVTEDLQPEGILAPVAEHITGMKVRCYDGTEWTDEWGKQNGRYPQLVEVDFLAVRTDSSKTLKRSLFINLPRMKSNQSNTDPQNEDDSKGTSQEYESYMSSDFSHMPDEETGK